MASRVVVGFLVFGTTLMLVGAGARAGMAESRSTVALHATLSAARQTPPPGVKAPLARGLFTATLSGRRLSWRLTFNGLSNAATSAHLHLGARGRTGPLELRLCRPCRSGARGIATLDQGSAIAARRGVAYVDLHTRANPRGEIRGQIASGTVPTLEILSPHDGDTITPPTPVRFTVTGFTLGEGGGHIQAFARGLAERVSVELKASDVPGLAYLPADKFLTGRRDLTFALARADGTLLENPEARVTVVGLTIRGGR